MLQIEQCIFEVGWNLLKKKTLELKLRVIKINEITQTLFEKVILTKSEIGMIKVLKYFSLVQIRIKAKTAFFAIEPLNQFP